MTTEKKVSDIFGRRFLSAKQVISQTNRAIAENRTNHNISSLTILEESDRIEFSNEVIELLGNDNSWHLVYDAGLSLLSIKKIFGSGHKLQPRHIRNNDWWLCPTVPRWAEKEEVPGYRLIKLAPSFLEMSWDQQQQEILKMGDGFCSISTRLAISAQIAYFLVFNKYIADNFCHRGPETAEISSGKQIKVSCLSNVGSKGFSFYHWPCENKDDTTGVLISKKPDKKTTI